MLGDLLQERRFTGIKISPPNRCLELVESLTGQFFKTLERPIERLQTSLQLVEPVRTVIDGAAIMAR